MLQSVFMVKSIKYTKEKGELATINDFCILTNLYILIYLFFRLDTIINVDSSNTEPIIIFNSDWAGWAMCSFKFIHTNWNVEERYRDIPISHNGTLRIPILVAISVSAVSESRKNNKHLFESIVFHITSVFVLSEGVTIRI